MFLVARNRLPNKMENFIVHADFKIFLMVTDGLLALRKISACIVIKDISDDMN